MNKLSRCKRGRKRLILVDLDGTVLKSNRNEIHPDTLNALKKASEQGHIVCIVTGRPERSSITFYNQLNLQTLLCNFNGADIHDPAGKKIKRLLFPIPEVIVNEIINEDYICNNLENANIEYYDTALCLKQDNFFETYFYLNTIANNSFVETKLINEWKGNATTITMEFKKQTNLDQVWQELKKYCNTIKVNTWRPFPENPDRVIFEISSKFINKGLTTQILAQYYNIDICDAIAYGDEVNDSDMLMTVGYGVAMKNGHAILKGVAKDITSKTNDEGGVGNHLTKLLNL